MKRYIKASFTSGLVGIWWIYNNQVIADVETIDEGYNDGDYINYDPQKNHQTEWRRLVKESLPEDEANKLIAKGYKCIERGRVIYNLRTHSYEVTCSEEVFKDWDKRQLIIDAFDLNTCRYDFIKLNHYYIAELTGNPELDRFEYGG